MFGMSSKEFWEDDPQLYWAYRTFYMKKIKDEMEMLNYKCWLEGSYTCLATSVALNNAFSKKKIEYPKEPFGGENTKSKGKVNKELNEKLKGVKDKDIRQQIEYNYWARL